MLLLPDVQNISTTVPSIWKHKSCSTNPWNNQFSYKSLITSLRLLDILFVWDTMTVHVFIKHIHIQCWTINILHIKGDKGSCEWWWRQYYTIKFGKWRFLLFSICAFSTAADNDSKQTFIKIIVSSQLDLAFPIAKK